MTLRVSRRNFLKGTAAAAGLTVLAGTFRAEAYAAGDKLGVAVVGVKGMMGGYSTSQAINENCVAMCDVDDANLAWGMDQAKGRNQTPQTFCRLPQDARQVPPRTSTSS